LPNFYAKVGRELAQGTDLCLAIIIRQSGSAPRGVGTRFFVRRDGSIEGTIGGGSLEARVIAAARQTLAEGASCLLSFRLRGADVADSEMLCGGNVDVYLEPAYAADPEARNIYQAAGSALKTGERALLATLILPGPLPGLAGRKMLFTKGKNSLGHLGSFACPWEENFSGLLEQRHPLPALLGPAGEGQPECFGEPIVKRPVVYLMGGGHVSMQLAGLVKMVGFDLVVADDRPEFANRGRFPQADEVWVNDFSNILKDISLGPDAYVVIITRGHMHDKVVLAQALLRETAYVGMIGSRRKREAIYKALLSEGLSREKLGAVHCPIGLPIGAQTPEEIAVSIAAELIAVRNGQTPPSQEISLHR